MGPVEMLYAVNGHKDESVMTSHGCVFIRQRAVRVRPSIICSRPLGIRSGFSSLSVEEIRNVNEIIYPLKTERMIETGWVGESRALNMGSVHAGYHESLHRVSRDN